VEASEKAVSRIIPSSDGKNISAWFGLSMEPKCWTIPSLTPIDRTRIPIKPGGLFLNTESGWIEAVNGRKMWWIPQSNRKRVAVTLDGKLASLDEAGRLMFADGTKVMEKEFEREETLKLDGTV
jgi:hypothetical protein